MDVNIQPDNVMLVAVVTLGRTCINHKVVGSNPTKLTADFTLAGISIDV